MGSFTSRLVVTPLPNGVDWELVEDFGYRVGPTESDEVIRVTKGFRTDFASIPQLFITLGGIITSALGYFLHHPSLFFVGVVVVFLSVLFPKAGEYSEAAVIHDYLYQHHGGKNRKYADDTFRDAMRALRVNPFKIVVMYWCVRLFSGLAWRPATRNVAKLVRYARRSTALQTGSQEQRVSA